MSSRSMPRSPLEPVGCTQCRPESAEAAWKFRQQLVCERTLVDESHFSLRVFSCPACAQRFLSAFTEVIERMGGEDARDWGLLPLAAEEAGQLLQTASPPTEEAIHAIAPTRRSLRYAAPHPTESSGAGWGAGTWVGIHD